MDSAEDKVVKKTETSAVERTRDRDVFSPYVDIYEDEDGLVLVADMPGVPPDRVDVRVDNGSLTLRGDVPDLALEGGQPIYAEYKTGDYERTFTISEAVDTERIEAAMSDGVLTLRLPKLARVKQRRIEVKPG